MEVDYVQWTYLPTSYVTYVCMQSVGYDMPSLLVISRTNAAHYCSLLAGLSTFVVSVVNIFHYSVCCTILSICSSSYILDLFRHSIHNTL